MNKPQRTWHDDVYFGVHYDLHATERDTQLGAAATAEHLRETFALIQPDWVQCDCKGHPGYTSWPTTTGTASPGIVADALRVHRDVTRELGIPLVMHYSGVIDAVQVEQHPDWAEVDAQGKPNTQSTCRLSSYVDELMIPQLREVIERYDVDGFWVDGDNWAVQPCYCHRCRAEFTRRTGIDEAPTDRDDTHWLTWQRFHADLFTAFVQRYAEAVHAFRPGCAVCSNWMYSLRQPEPVAAEIDYLSGDYMANWGMYRAALEARFIAQRGLSWDLMCWGFTKDYEHPSRCVWKPAVHLCQEVCEVLAQGGAVQVYGKPQRSGHLTSWHSRILGEVGAFCRARKPWSFRTTTVPQVAILHLGEHYYRHNAPCFNFRDAVDPLEGAMHAMLETQRSTDVLSEEMALERISDYPLVVVPEQTHLSEAMLSALEDYARQGGHVLMAGRELAAEAGGLVGCRDTGEVVSGNRASWGAVYLPTDGEAAGVAGDWTIVEPVGAEVLSYVLDNSEPGFNATEIPGITRRTIGRGSILALHGGVFSDYFASHDPRTRRLLRHLVDQLDIPWVVDAQGPARLELVARRGDTGSLLVHLINRGVGAMTYTQRTIVDEVPPITDITVKIRGPKPRQVTLEPDGQSLAWHYAAGVAHVEVPSLDIHRIIALA